MNRLLSPAAVAASFLAGLLALGWIGAGYIGHPLALAMTALIAAFYLLGGLELLRFQQATSGLSQALAALPETLPQLDGWLATLPPALQNTVRLRIEGERTALPGPAMTPYLVGLLVLLGMLGTFLGMVVTLNGTVSALESTTDLASIRASLAAPVKGLGLAFGTSVAGVAASAMLGLASALCRRERLQASQALDSKIATVLRGFSQAHRRQESYRTQQAQAELMPQLVDRLQAMMLQMEQREQALSEGLLSRQQALGDGLVASQQALSRDLLASQRALSHDLAAGQQALNERLLSGQQVLTEHLMASQQAVGDKLLSGQQLLGDKLQAHQDGFHRNAEVAYAQLAASVDQSLKHSLGESARLAGAAIQPAVEATMSGITRETNALHARVAEVVQQQLDGLSQRFGSALGSVADNWQQALATHAETSTGLAAETRAALAAYAQTFEQHSAAFAHSFERRSAGIAQTFEQRLAGFADAFEQRSARFADTFEQHSSAFADTLEHRSAAFAQTFEQRATALLAEAGKAQAESRAATAEQEQQRLLVWTQSLEVMASTLQREWQQAGEHSLVQQQRICETLDETARSIGTQAEAHARHTIAEITQLMHAAAEAPRVAAEVIGQLRQQLSDSMARDNTLLDERQRMMASLSDVLAAVHQASTDQRGAVDTLVSSTAATLDRVSSQLGETIATEAGQLSAAAAQITGSAVEVASLGEAFGFAVQLFSESNDKLMAQLQQIEASMARSTARSDEQLAYYVAQAREIIDLSISSQKQIVDDLQQFASKQDASQRDASKPSAGAQLPTSEVA